MAKTTPEVSIVMIVGERRLRSARALASVLSQEGLERAEVLLIENAGVGTEPLPGSDHERVRIISMPPPVDFGSLKAAGARQANGRIVAFLEDHIEVRPGWLMGILAAFQGPWSGVGAEVHNANPGVGLSDTLGLINYGLWAPPLSPGEQDMLAGNNTSYLREVLLSRDDTLAELLISDTVLQWELLAEGHRLYTTPAVSLLHRNPTTLFNGIKAEFYYHWCFGAVRGQAFNWPWWKRFGYILLSPIAPWLRYRRLYKLAAEKKSVLTASIRQNLLPTLIILHAAILGHNFGLIFGLEPAKQTFTDFELNSSRPKAEELDA